MGNADVLLLELLAEHDILVAAFSEPLVEGTAEHRIATDEEVARAERLVGSLLAHLSGVVGSLCRLVAVAQI